MERKKRRRIAPLSGQTSLDLAKEKVPTEHQEQVALCRLLRICGIYHAAVPNEGQRSFAVAHRLRNAGMVRGFPDLLIFTVPPGLDARGCAIELKRQRNSRATPEQKHQLQILESLGWRCTVAKGCDEAVEWLRGLGYELPRYK